MKIGQKLQTNLAWNILRQQKTMNVLFCNQCVILFSFYVEIGKSSQKKKKKKDWKGHWFTLFT